MPAKKKTVSSPLHLLQQLSRSLVEHLEKACSDAQKEAEQLLAKLETQRGKIHGKLVKARAKLDDADASGKAKSKSKAKNKTRERIEELKDMLALVEARQGETRAYIAGLERDAKRSLDLAEGISRVEEAAAQAVSSQGAPASSMPPPKAKRSVTRQAPNTDAVEAETKPAPAAKAAAKPRASRSVVSRAKPAAAAKVTGSETKPAAARKPATRKAVARKPVAKPGDAAQVPPSSS